MTDVGRVLESLIEDCYQVARNPGGDYTVTLPDRRRKVHLVMDDDAIRAFLRSQQSDAVALFPDVSAEKAAHQLLMANLAEGLDISRQVHVTSEGVQFLDRDDENLMIDDHHDPSQHQWRPEPGLDERL